MTVDELIQRLQELSNRGYGGDPVQVYDEERDVPWIGHIGYAAISAYFDFQRRCPAFTFMLSAPDGGGGYWMALAGQSCKVFSPSWKRQMKGSTSPLP